MPPNSSNPTPAANLLEDFYAECDEHLVEIRRCLLQLEEKGEVVEFDQQTVEKIFRSLHSVKGICGMAGLRAAENLAHAAEEYLRLLTRREATLSDLGLDLLTRVAQKLEELAVDHKEGRPEQDVQLLIQQTTALLPPAAQKPHTAPEPESEPAPTPSLSVPAEAPGRTGRLLFRCVFHPSAELDKRGVNLNSVRTQLQELGEIRRAAPKVEVGGVLSFEFLVATDLQGLAFQALEANGVTVSQVQESPATTEEKAPPTPLATSTSAFVAPSQFVRVDMARLDDLMRMMGDIVVQQARLEEALTQAADVLPSGAGGRLQEIRHGLNRELRHLRDGLMGLRLVPISEVFDRLPFVVRDISRENGRKVRLVVKGQNTELDKYLVERVKDPLLHLVRNAVSHGIEDSPERLAEGKKPEGTVQLQAYTIAETVLIEVTDDGRGIDPSKIAAAARRKGLAINGELNLAETLDLLCTPGFSTRDTADLGAGRGMGMAAVKSTIQDLGGEIELESEPNRGTTFRLRLPLTLAVADALIISAGGQRFAMPQAVVQEITTTEEAAISQLEQNELMRHRDTVLPLLRLSAIFGLTNERLKSYPVLVIGSGLNSIGIIADRVLGHREIVVRPIKDPLLKVPGISGATELGDGRAVLILDSVSLAQRARARQNASRRQAVNPSL